MKKLFIWCCVTAVIVVLFVPRLIKYTHFHNAEISGKVDAVYHSWGYVVISVNGDEYYITPIALRIKNNFDEVAKVGDEIRKNAGDDRFDLIHEEDGVFTYTVRKYW